MKTLISKKPILHLLQLPPNFLLSPRNRNQDFLRFTDQNSHYTLKTLTLCSSSSSPSLNYGGWDDFQLSSGSAHSGESNQLHSFLNSLGIGDKKYVFVYLFGFVCALAVSRVKVSSIIVFPVSAVLFAVGFSVGLVKGGGLKELKINGNKRKILDETFTGSIEKLRNLGDSLNGYNANVLKLKNDIRSGIEQNRVTVSDLEGYVDVLESDITLINAIDVVESCVKSMLGGNQEKEVGVDHEASRRRKKSDELGLNFSQRFNGLFGGKLDGSKLGKVKTPSTRKMMDADMSNQKQLNILDASVKERNLGSAWNAKVEDKSAGMFDNPFDSSLRSRDRVEDFADGSGIGDMVLEHETRNVAEENDTGNIFSDDTMYSYQNNAAPRFGNSQQDYLEDYQDETETMVSQSSSYDSVDFSISMNHKKSASSFGHQRKSESGDRNYSHFVSREEDKVESKRYSYKKEMFTGKKQPSFHSNGSEYEDVFDSSPSPVLGDDLNFNRYLTEANDLLKEAKSSLRQRVDDSRAENALHKSEILLSKAIDMRPMSLLAVGQLGNAYLLHGELKLRISQKLRKILARNGSSAGNTKDNIVSALGDVCEECEELLIKAGRKYKFALSIDGTDMRALYNWGLALSFRAQLIADIGPTSARDADKVFMAAIDKFDAMMSKSNVYAPDALFRWGAVLQQRSRLRPRNSREKVKLLQQAKRLYEDALHMDSRNLQLQEALSSCVSELEYWYR